MNRNYGFKMIMSIIALSFCLIRIEITLSETFTGNTGGECVYYARIHTGNNLENSPYLGKNGGAHLIFDYWGYGFGKGELPAENSLIVLDRRLGYGNGHVGVVRQVSDLGNGTYELRVDESNFYPDQIETTNSLYRYNSVVHTAKREWNNDLANRFGTVDSPLGLTSYPVLGFVYTQDNAHRIKIPVSGKVTRPRYFQHSAKNRLQNDLIFYFQNTQSFKGFWKQVSALQGI